MPVIYQIKIKEKLENFNGGGSQNSSIFQIVFKHFRILVILLIKCIDGNRQTTVLLLNLSRLANPNQQQELKEIIQSKTVFTVYELDTWTGDLNTDFTLKDYLFGVVKLTKNAGPDKYSYFCQF